VTGSNLGMDGCYLDRFLVSSVLPGNSWKLQLQNMLVFRDFNARTCLCSEISTAEYVYARKFKLENKLALGDFNARICL
jgi:hypothetical protein